MQARAALLAAMAKAEPAGLRSALAAARARGLHTFDSAVGDAERLLRTLPVPTTTPKQTRHYGSR